jgi:hypothetical protein
MPPAEVYSSLAFPVACRITLYVPVWRRSVDRVYLLRDRLAEGAVDAVLGHVQLEALYQARLPPEAYHRFRKPRSIASLPVSSGFARGKVRKAPRPQEGKETNTHGRCADY